MNFIIHSRYFVRFLSVPYSVGSKRPKLHRLDAYNANQGLDTLYKLTDQKKVMQF